LQIGVRKNACIVDENVAASKAIEHLPSHCFDLIGLADVTGQADLLSWAGKLCETLGGVAPVDHHHVRAIGGKTSTIRVPDPSCATRHHRRFSWKCHRRLVVLLQAMCVWNHSSIGSGRR
jgi:hypothetical protein